MKHISDVKHHLCGWASKCLLHASVFIFTLLTSSNANPQWTTVEVMIIKVTHGTLCCLEVLVFTEPIAFWFAGLTIIHKPNIIKSHTMQHNDIWYNNNDNASVTSPAQQ